MSNIKKHFNSNNVLPTITEGSALPTRIQLFKVGNNENSYNDLAVYNPELKDKILSNQLMQDGRDLYPIDLEHERGASQGWFELLIDETGIYADNIQWTRKGAEALSNREFRFYSPTFYTDESGNIVQIDSFALTNSPALYNLTPIVASKCQKDICDSVESPCSGNKATKETYLSDVKETKLTMSTVTDKVEEFKAAVEQEFADNAPIDEKDQLIADLQSQNEALQSKLEEALAKLDEMHAAEMAKEKEAVMSSLEFSSDAEKAFFSKMDLEALKEYAALKPKKVDAPAVEPIEPEEKEFVKATKPTASPVVQKFERKSTLPSFEQIKAQAQRIANQRNKV